MCLKKPLITEYKKLYAFENLTDVKSIHIKYDAEKGQYTIEDESADKNKLKIVAEMFNLVRLYCEMISIEKRKYNEIKELNENLGVFRDKSKKILLSEDVEINDDMSLQQEENKSNKESASKIIEPIIKAVAITEKIYNLITILLKEKQRGEEVAAIDILKETSWQVNKTQDDNLKKEIGTELDKLFKKYNDKGCKGLAEIVLTSYLPFVKIYRVCQKITNLSDYQEDLRQKNFCFEEEEVTELEKYCKNNKKDSIRNGDLLNNDSSRLRKLGQKIDVIFKAEKLAYKNENDAEFIKTISNYTQASDELKDNREAIANIANTSLSKRRRKYKSIISAIIIILIIGTACVNICKPLIKYQHMAMSLSYSTESGKFEFRKYDNSGAEIISAVPFVSKEDGKFEFPSQVALNSEGWFDKDVVAIGANVFGEESEKNFTAVFIPESITHIDSNAFDGCENITILCEIAERPDGYETGWSGKNTVIWSWQSGVEFSTVVIDGINFILQKDTAILKGLEGEWNGSLEIPSEITVGGKDYKVTQIAGNALSAENDFEKFAQISSITVPDSVTSIGQAAFGGCSNLTSITLPFVGAELNGTTNTHFGYIFGAGGDKENVDKVPDTLSSIIISGGTVAANAFYGCSIDGSVVFEQNVTAIAQSALLECSVKSLTLPFLGENESDISHAFFGYIFGATTYDQNDRYVPESLKLVTITANKIGDYAFANCSSLEKILVSDGIQEIGCNVFEGCNEAIYNTDTQGAKYIDGISSIRLILVDGTNVSGAYTPNANTRVIANNAFEGCTELSGITIPQDVVMIGDNAFAGCTGITEMVIPNNVQSIGDYAFSDCSGLTSITIPDSVTSIGDRAFQNCSGLTSITIGDSVTSIEENAFIYCSGIIRTENGVSYVDKWVIDCDNEVRQVRLRDDTVGIADRAFYNCSSLTSITIPDSVTSIGDYAFYNCSGLTNINIPDSVTSIGDGAFSNCSGLTNITIPDSITTIGNSAFSNCSGLTNITIPDGVTSIGDYAFSGCSGLTNITIPDGVTSIGDYAFYYCRGLTNITIPDSVISIGVWAFWNCHNMKSVVIGDGVAKIEEGTFSGCSLTNVIIGRNVTSIGNMAFQGCRATSITIPDSVTNIGNGAFYFCENLTSITIPDGVTSIGERVFYNCSGLTNINIPDSVTSIGDDAFYNCSGLTNINISNGVTSIGDDAFYYCSGLTSITIPDSVTSIGDSAFAGCNALTIYCELTSEPSGWSDSWNYSNCPVVWNCNNNEADNDGNIYYIGDNGIRYAINNGMATIIRQGTALSGEIIIPEEITYKEVAYSITTINASAFYDCSGLTSITIPDSVTSIGEWAFSGCSGLTSITIPDSVTSIEDRVFYGCIGLTNITIPDSVTSIGVYAFYSCTRLTSITIPDSVTSIGDGAFSSCNGLVSITIPFVGGSIKTASDTYQYPLGYIFGHTSSAFSDRTQQYYYGSSTSNTTSGDYYIPSSLKSVTVTGGNILYGAFYNCSGLTNITIHDGVTSIGEHAFA